MPDTNARNSRLFYGWIIVIACSAITFTLGEAMWSLGVFFKPLESEFGWSRTETSSAFTALIIGYSVSVVVSGRLVDRYRPRAIILAVAVLAGLGASLSSTVTSLTGLRAFMFITGLGAGGTWSVPASVVQQWFYGRRRAGLALSVTISGVGVGGLVFAPLMNHLIITQGWRHAFLVAGIIFFSVLAVASTVIKKAPQEVVRSTAGTGGETGASVEWTTRRVLATPAYLGVVFCSLVAVFAFYGLSVHLVPYATDVGISPAAAARALGMMGGFSILGRLSGGPIADRIGWQRTMGLALLGLGVTVLWLLLLRANWMLYAFVFFYGVFHGTQSPTQVGILGHFFGMRSLGELIGISSSAGQAAGAFAPYMAGFIFDATGSYTVAFVVVIAMLFTGSVVVFRIREPKPRA